jgi:isoprenylcysteine carboxyl methyltransferase (ICMT) family protein YpbQ
MERPREVAPGWVVAMGRVIRHLMTDYGGGARLLKLGWIINFQKLTTIPMLLLLMNRYGNESVAAWIYLALQGSYALVWLVKDLAFPDARFHQPATIGAGIASLMTVLGWYWVLGWLMIARGRQTGYPLADAAWFSLCISLCIVGCVIMIGADAQKYFTLRVRSGLITDGMYRFVRHPNYLGEMLIYISFALMIWNWLAVLLLAWIWGGLFVVNMMLKEVSLSRYPGWADYKSRTWWLLPPLV